MNSSHDNSFSTTNIILDPLYLSGHELLFVVEAKPTKAEFIRELKFALITWVHLSKERENFKLKDEQSAWELALAVRRNLGERNLDEFSFFEICGIYAERSLFALSNEFPDLIGKNLIEAEFFSAWICELT